VQKLIVLSQLLKNRTLFNRTNAKSAKYGPLTDSLLTKNSMFRFKVVMPYLKRLWEQVNFSGSFFFKIKNLATSNCVKDCGKVAPLARPG